MTKMRSHPNVTDLINATFRNRPFLFSIINNIYKSRPNDNDDFILQYLL